GRGQGLEGHRRPAGPDDDGPRLVKGQHAADGGGLPGPEELAADLIEDDGVGAAEVLDPAEEHVLGGADEGVVVEALEDDLLEAAVAEVGAADAAAPADGPGDAGGGADRAQLVVGQRLAGVD